MRKGSTSRIDPQEVLGLLEKDTKHIEKIKLFIKRRKDPKTGLYKEYNYDRPTIAITHAAYKTLWDLDERPIEPRDFLQSLKKNGYLRNYSEIGISAFSNESKGTLLSCTTFFALALLEPMAGLDRGQLGAWLTENEPGLREEVIQFLKRCWCEYDGRGGFSATPQKKYPNLLHTSLCLISLIEILGLSKDEIYRDFNPNKIANLVNASKYREGFAFKRDFLYLPNIYSTAHAIRVFRLLPQEFNNQVLHDEIVDFVKFFKGDVAGRGFPATRKM